MTLTTAQATVLGRSVVAFRDRWDLAGIMAAIDKLATDPRHPAAIWQQVVLRACDPKSATPEALLWPVETEATVRAFPSQPSDRDPVCGVHGSNIVDVAGVFVCCRDEGNDDTTAPSYLRVGRSPAPPDFRKNVAARIEANRAAKEAAK